MPLVQVVSGNRVLAADLNQFFNLLKGVAASGEAITLIYNGTALIFQPSADPAAGTRVLDIKNNAGTHLMSIDYNGVLELLAAAAAPSGAVAGAVYFDTVINSLRVYDGTVWQNASGAKKLVSRFLNNATINISNSSIGTYVDFGGSFTTSVTTITGDQVCLRIQSVIRKQTAGAATVVVDRGGTKLPGATTNSSVYIDLIGTKLIPFSFEYWDAPAAGTYTYKPQLYVDDNNTANVGLGLYCQYVVELWR